MLPFGGGPYRTFGPPREDFIDRVDPGLGRSLKALGCDIVWATTWMERANQYLAPWLGWDVLLVLHSFADDPPAPGVHWKTPALVDYAAGRSFVWIDDEIGQGDEFWVSLHHPADALLVRVDSSSGLDEVAIRVVEDWCATSRDRGVTYWVATAGGRGS